jgi:molybdate transport system regulatory protein
MKKNRQNFVIRSKIWIEDESGNVIFGDGRYRILELVDRYRSLQGAAKELKMSYRALWGRIKASEERIGRPLVTREGKGSCLTPFGLELMERFQEMKKNILDESDKMYDNLMSEHLGE